MWCCLLTSRKQLFMAATTRVIWLCALRMRKALVRPWVVVFKCVTWLYCMFTVYYAVQDGSNFKSVDETLVCDHSNESYLAVLSCGTALYPHKQAV